MSLPAHTPPAGRYCAALARLPSSATRLALSSPAQAAVLHGQTCYLLGDRFSGLRELLEAWPADGRGVAAALQLDSAPAHPLTTVRLEAPVAANASVFAIGKNYLEHVKEVGSSLPGISSGATPSFPIVFAKGRGSVCGPHDAILLPLHAADAVDYEGEAGVVVGRECSNVSASDALSYVFGITALNDVSARDLQQRHQQWLLGKSCPNFCPTGPWLVPLRCGESGDMDVGGLDVRTWVNGELRQEGNTAQLIFAVSELIETISACTTLYPGDIIATGTPAGVGAGFKPPRFLRAGDSVAIEVGWKGSPLARLKNSVAAATARARL